MAGHRTLINGTLCFVDYADAEGQARVGGRLWRWEFHRYLGPTFLRKDGEARVNQDPPKAVWRAFERWQQRFLEGKRGRVRSDQM